MPGFTTLLDKNPSCGSLCPELVERYCGGLDFPDPPQLRPYVYSNFVVTLDGMVTFGLMDESEGRAVSMKSVDDQWLMALLRASADAVLVGAGTLRAESEHTWTVESLTSVESAPFAQWRRACDRSARPLQCFVTRSGEINTESLVFRDSSLSKIIFTTKAGAEHIGSVDADVVAFNSDSVDLGEALRILRRDRGVRNLLTEGGPRMYAQLLDDDLVDESFQTISPQFAGERDSTKHRFALTEGVRWIPSNSPKVELVSARVGQTDANHLFLRYRILHD